MNSFIILLQFRIILLPNKLSLKVETILKGSLDSILSPSPSVKIQIVGGKICLSCLKKIWGILCNLEEPWESLFLILNHEKKQITQLPKPQEVEKVIPHFSMKRI